MTIDQVVQSSYMEPNAFKTVNSFDLKVLAGRVKDQLTKLNHCCPQSPKKDRTIYQYKHALSVINQFIG